ncbi:MAG TPA: OmpA family protein [Moraxellaceae bacterium]|nr:OmpA family protein [Moraxellaceae bacterium]
MKRLIALTLLVLPASLLAQDAYWENSRGEIWRNSYGECWRTSHWTPDAHVVGCDGYVAPAPMPARRAEKPAVVTPPPAPAVVAVDESMTRDSDGDGVVDALDKCPGTRRGAKVDANGCYVVLKEAVTMTIDVKFPPGSSKIDARGDAEIKKLADFMNQYPQTSVEVAGHTDNTGNAAANRKLSQQRADAVREHLVGKFGVDGKRVTAKGYGPDKPIADNKTAAGRNANRRVEATISQTVDKIQD